MAAVNIPLPIKPIWAGSCPAPPPETMATFDLSQSLRTTNFREGNPSARVRLPLPSRLKRPSMAWVTTVVESLKNRFIS
ncbi:hypothetical protein PXD56_12760 [Maribacter sp. SA7]|uniref:hypothetical protein n=1 Tax=Maribacter zhoushanensis TaxID=3030012 RepID=UPI0023EC1930|nr:hypothetical protein [Maribacter zhoushanensis]MDF4203837.1 hypothetical protein [Maribacter zhoushanensis]